MACLAGMVCAQPARRLNHEKLKGGRLKQTIAENQNICYDRFHERRIESCSQSTRAGSRVIFHIDAVYLSGRSRGASVNAWPINPAGCAEALAAG